MSLTVEDDAKLRPLDGAFMVKVFYAFAILAALSVAISVGGRWVGRSIATAGHTQDTTPRTIVIGANTLSVPANMIRMEKSRTDGETHKLELYALWPSMSGYSDADRDEFNHRDGRRNIVFMTLEPSMMSRDMSGRLEPIYRQLIELPGAPGPSGLRFYPFSAQSGYVNEKLAVEQPAAGTPFVARCLTGPTADESLASCERDVHLSADLSLTYRFPESMLQNWRALDAAVQAKAAELLRAAP